MTRDAMTPSATPDARRPPERRPTRAAARAAAWLIASLLATPAGAAADRPSGHDASAGLPAAAIPGAARPVDPWEAIAPGRDPIVLRRSSRPAGAATGNTPARSSPGWLRTTGSLAAVVALIMLLAWGYRTVAGGSLSLAGRGRVAGLIDVVSRTAVSPRQSLVLVRVGPRMVLLGVGPERIETLDAIDDPALVSQLAGAATVARGDSSTAEFRAALREQERQYSADAVEHSEPKHDDADELSDRLARTLCRIRASAERLGAA